MKARKKPHNVDPRDHWEPEREPVRVCSSCCGMPWARHGDRRNHAGKSAGVFGKGGWKCRECKEPYQAPPELKGGSTIRSCGGTVADAAMFHAIGITGHPNPSKGT